MSDVPSPIHRTPPTPTRATNPSRSTTTRQARTGPARPLAGWTGSTRRSRLPADWAQRRAAVLTRDPICRHCHQAPATEADHIKAGDDHRLTNLQGLCLPCHLIKSSAEGHAARYAHPRRRPTEPHPGLR